MSTFGGISAMGDAMQAAMQAIAITAKNIANANNPDYSREEVTMTPGNGGAIVECEDPERIRDEALDEQFREDNSEYQEFAEILEGLQGVEGIISEVDGGLSSAISEMEAALTNFIANPTDPDAANAFRTSVQKVVSTFNSYYDGLVGLMEAELEELENSCDEVDALIDQIAVLNEQIRIAEATGYVPPELLDARDAALDELSNYIEFEVEENPDGTINIKTQGANGEDIYLLDNTDPDNVKTCNLTVDASGYPDSPVTIVDAATGQTLEPTGGSMSGSLTLLNGQGSYAEGGESTFNGFPYYIQAFNELATHFAECLNTGQDPNDIIVYDPANPAGTIRISDEWANDPLAINTGDPNQELINIQMALEADHTWSNGDTGNVQDFLGNILANNANDTKYYTDMTETKLNILKGTMTERDSVMSVIIDEELMKMKTYQYQFEACAAMMKTMNEMMDVILMLGEY